MCPIILVTELSQVISGATKGRRDAAQITLFDSVGFAIEDFSALGYVRDQLKSTSLYQELDMLADPDEPRELFGMLLRADPSGKASADPCWSQAAPRSIGHHGENPSIRAARKMRLPSGGRYSAWRRSA